MKPVKTGTVHPVPSVAKQSGWRDLLFEKAAPYLFTAPFVLSFLVFFYTPSLASSS